MKLRLLNAGHQVLAYVGLLRGHTYAHEAMADPDVTVWLERYWNELALPTTELPSGVDGAEYVRVLAERFGNPAIADTLERLATGFRRLDEQIRDAGADPGAQPQRRSPRSHHGSWPATRWRSLETHIACDPRQRLGRGACRTLRRGEPGGLPRREIDWLAPLGGDAPIATPSPHRSAPSAPADPRRLASGPFRIEWTP